MLHGQEIKTMTGHTQPITSLSFSAESSRLVSGGLDCTVRVWDVKTSGGPKKAVANVASTLLSGDEVQERYVACLDVLIWSSEADFVPNSLPVWIC